MANLAYIQITRRCNQKCLFCSNPPSGLSDMSLGEAKKLVDGYLKKKYAGVILSGGEPTVYPYLADLIAYCEKKGLPVRIITNGQKICDDDYLKSLIGAGLQHLCLSIYSHKPEIQSRLTGNEESLKNIEKSLKNIGETKIRVDVCIAINKYNAGYLDELVKYIFAKYPFVKHFVFNNLDPTNDRAKQNLDTVPKLIDLEIGLIGALKFLESYKKTFRIERIPLCYLTGFEHCSTETRKIVKEEIRPIYFLDEKGFLLQEGFAHQKAKQCAKCFLNDICAGLFQGGKHFDFDELYPVFVSKEGIITKILNKP